MQKAKLFYNLRYKLSDLIPLEKKGTTLREFAIDQAIKEAKTKFGMSIDRSKVLAASIMEESGITAFEAEGIQFRFELIAYRAEI